MNRNHYPKITVVRGADHKEIEVYVIPDEYFSNGTRYEHETPDGGIDYYNDFELIQNKDLLSHNQVELIFPYEPPVKADLALALKRAGFNYECPTAYIFKESGKPIGLIKHSVLDG